MKKIIVSLTETIADLLELPKQGPNSLSVNNAPHYGGYEIRQELETGGVCVPFQNKRHKPHEMVMVLKTEILNIKKENELKIKLREELKRELMAELLHESLKQNKNTKTNGIKI